MDFSPLAGPSTSEHIYTVMTENIAQLPDDRDAVQTSIRDEDERPVGFFRYIYRILKSALAILIVLACGLFGGFISFAVNVAGMSVPEGPHADGVVVLTGGADRIDTALQLLEAGAGERLLISGVNRSVTMADLRNQHPGYDQQFECCVDLDFIAANTIGNATLTDRWSRSNGFQSLLVVTSAYHMPRALAELSAQADNLKLIAIPVKREELNLSRWFQDTDAIMLLGAEYGKFLAAAGRLTVKRFNREFGRAVEG